MPQKHTANRVRPGARLKRCGKSAPRFRQRRRPRQTPPGARPNRDDTEPSGSRAVSGPVIRVGRAKRPATGVPDEWSSSAGQLAWTKPGLQAGWQFCSRHGSSLSRLLSHPIIDVPTESAGRGPNAALVSEKGWRSAPRLLRLCSTTVPAGIHPLGPASFRVKVSANEPRWPLVLLETRARRHVAASQHRNSPALGFCEPWFPPAAGYPNGRGFTEKQRG